MNKLLFVFLLFALSTCADARISDLIDKTKGAAANAASAASNAATNLSNAASTLSDKVNQVGQQISQINDTIVSQATVTAAQLSTALSNIRSAAEEKIDMIDELLNKTSSSEKAVVEQAFEVVEAVITQINALTNLNITNEYEAAEVSAYIQEKIAQASDLLSSVRKYINDYVDKANETIRSVASAIQIPDTIGTYVGAASAALQTIAGAINDMKEKYNLNPEDLSLDAPSVSDYLSDIDLSQLKYEDVVEAISKIGSDNSAIVEFIDSLPDSPTKEKLQKIVDAIRNTANTVANVASAAANIYNSGKNIYNTGKDAVNSIKNLIKSF